MFESTIHTKIMTELALSSYEELHEQYGRVWIFEKDEIEELVDNIVTIVEENKTKEN